MGRAARLLLGTFAILAAATGLAACGSDGTGLARQACVHIGHSIDLLQRATAEADPSRATELRQRADAELIAALPIAAQAAYQDSQWQSLTTTLSESDRVPEQMLVPSLRSQCRVANGSVFDQQPPPSSIPPPRSGT